jgi:hypothetical protein
MDAASANLAQYLPGQREGHYESFFQRANHPTRPLAFWIRYTIFSPHGAPKDAIGELWAVFFDGETGRHTAVKEEVPIAAARFDRRRFEVRVADARLDAAGLVGSAASRGHRISWDMRYRSDEAPLFLFPTGLYEAPLPKAKSLVGAPLATFSGTISVDDRVIDVGGWTGSQNHNWGSKHTDEYAWGQVAGFDSHPRTFLEIATARIKLGPVRSPWLTPVVLRHDGREHVVNSPLDLARGRSQGAYEPPHDGAASGPKPRAPAEPFTWRFSFDTGEVEGEGRIEADREDFVGLAYANPPGGTKHCLNTKIATCTLSLRHTHGPARGRVEELVARRRAAFEILTDDHGHGIEIRA